MTPITAKQYLHIYRSNILPCWEEAVREAMDSSPQIRRDYASLLQTVATNLRFISFTEQIEETKALHIYKKHYPNCPSFNLLSEGIEMCLEDNFPNCPDNKWVASEVAKIQLGEIYRILKSYQRKPEVIG